VHLPAPVRKIFLDLAIFFNGFENTYTRVMRRDLAPLLLAAAIVPGAALPPPIGGAPDSATIVATPAAAAARPSALLLKLHYDMLCAQPGRGPVVVTFPRALRLPPRIARTAVQVDDKAAPSVTLHDRTATIALALNSNVICQSLVPGTLRVAFTRAARLGNPAHAGTYVIRAQVGTHSFVARLQIRR
jgi:hypothetical protein